MCVLDFVLKHVSKYKHNWAFRTSKIVICHWRVCISCGIQHFQESGDMYSKSALKIIPNSWKRWSASVLKIHWPRYAKTMKTSVQKVSKMRSQQVVILMFLGVWIPVCPRMVPRWSQGSSEGVKSEATDVKTESYSLPESAINWTSRLD